MLEAKTAKHMCIALSAVQNPEASPVVTPRKKDFVIIYIPGTKIPGNPVENRRIMQQ